MKKHYIKAVLALLQKGSAVDDVLTNLKKVLLKKGHQKLYAPILHGVETELSQRKNALDATVVVASEADAKKLQAAIQAALQQLGGDQTPHQLTVDETIIGGFVASHKGMLINRSYKEKLVSLYRSITK